MTTTSGETLQDLGELRLVDEIIMPLARAYDTTTRAGDDCAYVSVGGLTFAATADVGPRPLIQSLSAYREDWEAAGWLAVVATASDIATAGALPLLLTNCIDAPPDLPVSVLREFMTGYFRAMKEFGFKNGGGDLRQGPSLYARVFGVGTVEHETRLGRSGATPGDRLVVIGPAGEFMSEFVLARAREQSGRSENVEPIPQRLRFPRPQIEEMRHLATAQVVSAASDTSDGLLGAIDNISRSSKCGFHLELEEGLLTDPIRSACKMTSVASAWNLFFAWGDWSVAAIVPDARFEAFEKLCRSSEIEWRLLGRATAEPGCVTASVDGGPVREVSVIRNENYLPRGFNAGISGHLDYILATPLFQD